MYCTEVRSPRFQLQHIVFICIFIPPDVAQSQITAHEMEHHVSLGTDSSQLNITLKTSFWMPIFPDSTFEIGNNCESVLIPTHPYNVSP